MAGIIDIRYNLSTKTWAAQPRFKFGSLLQEPPIGVGRFAIQALEDLCNRVPEDIANKIHTHMDHRVYDAPERLLGEDHKCLDLDGHRPTPYEFKKRHDDYLLQKQLGRDYRSVHY